VRVCYCVSAVCERAVRVCHFPIRRTEQPNKAQRRPATVRELTHSYFHTNSRCIPGFCCKSSLCCRRSPVAVRLRASPVATSAPRRRRAAAGAVAHRAQYFTRSHPQLSTHLEQQTTSRSPHRPHNRASGAASTCTHQPPPSLVSKPRAAGAASTRTHMFARPPNLPRRLLAPARSNGLDPSTRSARAKRLQVETCRIVHSAHATGVDTPGVRWQTHTFAAQCPRLRIDSKLRSAASSRIIAQIAHRCALARHSPWPARAFALPLLFLASLSGERVSATWVVRVAEDATGHPARLVIRWA